MIRVINLSPAIDVTYFVSDLVPGQSHRVKSVYRSPGGKGVNVARIIHGYGSAVELLLPLGGERGDWVQSQLADLSIPVQRVSIAQQTRTCIAVVDDEATVFNEQAPQLSESEFAQILEAASVPVKTTVISGSLPSGLDSNQVADLFSRARQASEFLIVDTSGSPLLLAAAAGADLIKPNLEEALTATNKASATEAVTELLALGAKKVLLSLGKDGLSLYDKTRLDAHVEQVSGNATGAGDAVTAMAAIGLTENQPPEEWLATAAAAGMLAVQEPTAGVIAFEKLAEAANRIQITEEKWH